MNQLYSSENLNAFATAWYLALDNHAPTDELVAFLSDEVQMVFPEKTLPKLQDFKAWYEGGTCSDDSELPGVINIFFDESHNLVSIDVSEGTADDEQIEVSVMVAWQASWFVKPATKARRTSMDATQSWKLAPSDKNRFGFVITSYNAVAKPFQYAPGFARL